MGSFQVCFCIIYKVLLLEANLCPASVPAFIQESSVRTEQGRSQDILLTLASVSSELLQRTGQIMGCLSRVSPLTSQQNISSKSSSQVIPMPGERLLLFRHCSSSVLSPFFMALWKAQGKQASNYTPLRISKSDIEF
jgi:hypothetical protein